MRLKMEGLLRLITGCLLLGAGSVGVAATYDLSSGQYPPCSTPWSVSGDTYTCTGDGRISLGNNDIVIASRASTLRADNGFSLSNGRIGSAGAPIALVSTYGTVTSSRGAVVFGDIQANALIELTGATVTGNLNTTNRVSLDKSTVNGNVTAATSDARTIKGTGNSFIYGVCVPSITTPPKLCSGEAPIAGVHHYRLSFASQALTCQAQTVVASACMNAECSTVSSSASTLTITPGGTAMTFTGQGTGSVAVRTAQTVILSVSAASPAPSNPTLCQVDGVVSANCSMTFNDSGFVMRDLSPLVAGKPRTATIQAVRKSDSSPGCAPAFSGGPRTLQFSARYVEPTGPFGTALTLRVGNTDLVPGGPAQNVSLTFDSSATAPFPVSYLDAGVVRLNAAFTGTTSSGPGGQSEVGLQMTGSSELVSRPFGLCLETDLKHDSSKRFARAAGGETVHVAGKEFELRVRAVAWTPADEPDPDASAPRQPRICENPTTPNYEQAGISLTHAVLEPDPPANNGNLTIDSYAHQRGERTVLAGQKIDEVGIFQLTAEPPTYWGHSMAHAVTLSDRIGRFIPAYFSLEDPEVTQSCGSFTYAGLLEKSEPPSQLEKKGQPFYVSGKLYALNRNGDVTQNYKDNFSKLTPDGLDFIDSRKVGNKIIFELGDFVEAIDGNGDRYFNYERDLQFFFETPTGPYKLAMQVIATDDEGVEGAVVDRGEDLEGNKDDDFLPEFRLGIARLSNAHGSELQNLSLAFTTAYFDGSSYVLNGQDNCSVLAYSSELDIVNLNGDLKNDTEIVNRDSPLLVVKGKEQIVLKAPIGGKTGSVEVTPTLEGAGWLKYEWDGDDELKAPTGLATFGIYKGPKPLIFRRELYRGM